MNCFPELNFGTSIFRYFLEFDFEKLSSFIAKKFLEDKVNEIINTVMMEIFHFGLDQKSPGIWDFFKSWDFLSPGFGDFFKSEDFHPGDSEFLKSGNLHPQGLGIFENLGIFIPGFIGVGDFSRKALFSRDFFGIFRG